MTCWMWLLALISRAKQSTEFGWIFSLPPFTISWVSQLLQAYSHPGDSSYSLGWAQLPWHSVPSQWWCPHCYWKPIEKRLELICRQSSTWKHLKPCELHIIWILKRILRSIEALTLQTCSPGQVPLCQGTPNQKLPKICLFGFVIVLIGVQPCRAMTDPDFSYLYNCRNIMGNVLKPLEQIMYQETLPLHSFSEHRYGSIK